MNVAEQFLADQIGMLTMEIASQRLRASNLEVEVEKLKEELNAKNGGKNDKRLPTGSTK